MGTNEATTVGRHKLLPNQIDRFHPDQPEHSG